MRTTKTYQSMFERIDPLAFRGLAFATLLIVLTTTRWLSTSWVGFVAGLAIFTITCVLLPSRQPTDSLRLQFVRANKAAGRLPSIVQLVLATVALGCASAFDSFNTFTIGREFNLYLCAIFLATIAFGLRIALLAWIIGALLVHYLVIPPRFSLKIGSLNDFADFWIFLLLGLATLAIATLIRGSSAATDDERAIKS